MSFNQLDSTFDELQNVINDCQTDVTKFVERFICRTKLFDGYERG